MNETLHRYPGAQPFGDDEFSRRIFFGRDKASLALTDQILANRLVIVYAKSGSGKTSLLNAGVAPRLRDAGQVPLFVRVNDRKRGPLASVFEGIRSECGRQKLEYVAGDTSSLWSFFKTVEFWRDDVLLTPVLIIDQFEELFTLQPFAEREKFLTELGALLRGTPPVAHDAEATGVSASPPPIHAVLSLREDFLGLLDEGSDRIPEIMDHRYRLAPLSAALARDAITGPAALEGEGLSTRAFRLEPECVASIVNYLSRSAASREEAMERRVEPFHLQMICQLIESVAAFKQKSAKEQVVLSFADIGGDAALAETLEDFYDEAIRSLPRKRRRGARRLCAHLLISVEGRRLSVEERELCRHSRMSLEDLRQLVERRLLRTDRRSDRTYYELGHDALVQPVLASRRTQAFILYSSAIFGGSTLSVAMAIMVIALMATMVKSASSDDRIFFPIFAVICLIVGAVGVMWLRVGVRSRTRYGEHDASESAELPVKRLGWLKSLVGWSIFLIGPALIVTWVVVGICYLTLNSAAVIRHGALPPQLSLLSKGAASQWQKMHHHQLVDLVWMFLEYVSVVVLGMLMYRQAGRMLWPRSSTSRVKAPSVRAFRRLPALVPPSLLTLAGAVGLVLGVLGFFTMHTCSASWHGPMAAWMQWPMMNDQMMDACSTIRMHSWFFDWDGITLFAFFLSVVILSAAAIWTGVADLRAVMAYRRGTKEKSASQIALMAAAGCVVLFVLVLPFAKAWLRPAPRVDIWVGGVGVVVHTEDGGGGWNPHTISGTTFESIKYANPNAIFAVGKEGRVWRTMDGGATWSLITWGAGDHKGIALEGVSFSTPQTGWIVGEKNTLLKSVDGGNTWDLMDTSKSKNFATTPDLLDLTFASPQNGWIIGDAGNVLHTEDGGHSWGLQKTPGAANLFYVGFATPACGWITGSSSSIFHTQDGGTTWTAQHGGVKEALDGIGAVSCTSAWVVGDKGRILHTEDGGATWKLQSSGTGSRLYEIAFSDARTGWTVGDDGVILHTEDGGEHWKFQLSGTDNGLSTLTIVKP
jgi:photosystem II stability/assembly factor-like uncharacterized protein